MSIIGEQFFRSLEKNQSGNLSFIQSKIYNDGFERSAINAFNKAFTSTKNSFTMSGSFFHLQNSIQRKLRVNN